MQIRESKKERKNEQPMNSSTEQEIRNQRIVKGHLEYRVGCVLAGVRDAGEIEVRI